MSRWVQVRLNRLASKKKESSWRRLDSADPEIEHTGIHNMKCLDLDVILTGGQISSNNCAIPMFWPVE